MCACVGVQNVYDVILDTNGVPILPELPAELYMVSAAQVSPHHDVAQPFVLLSNKRRLESPHYPLSNRPSPNA